MPLYKGNKNISAIYKGTTQISAIYKGTILVYSSAFWQSLFYSYLYNDLIPTTIDNKNVLDKAKVSKIYANGVVENQLLDLAITSQTLNGVSIVVNNGVITLNGTATALINIPLNQTLSITTHNYLFSGISGGSSSTYQIVWDAVSISNKYIFDTQIWKPSNNDTSRFRLRIQSGATLNNVVIIPQFIDLALREGAGNEPTALTDKRIQAILNRGYIPYNTGEYKGTSISEFSSEPYNLFNLDRQIGNTTGWDWDTTNSRNFEADKFYVGISSNNYFIPTTITSYSVTNNSVTVNVTAGGYGIGFPVRVMPNQRYTIEYQTDDVSQPNTSMGWFDENGKLISFDNDLINKTSPANAYWGLVVLTPSSTNRNVTFTNICLHRTGTRTGYAPYTEPQTLSFIYQGNGALNAKDTYELTKTNHIFTKNVGIVDLGTLNISEVDSTIGYAKYYGYVSTPTPGYAAIPNIVCQKYETASLMTIDNKSKDKIIGIGNDWQKPIIYDPGFIGKSSAEIKSSLSGVYLAYELATPQVITIPRKHLGIKKISSLTDWITTTAEGHKVFLTTQIRSGNNYLVYCKDYLYSNGGLSNMQIRTDTYFGPDCLYILDDSCSSVADFIAKRGDYYIFYETNAEVSDIADTISIEAGGSITSDSEVLPDVEFSVKCK